MSKARRCRGVMRLRRGLYVRSPGRSTEGACCIEQVWPIVAIGPSATYCVDVRMVWIVGAGIGSLLLSACGSSSIAEDAATACGWEEPSEPIVSAVESTPEDLVRNADRAQRRLAAAERVVEADARFGVLVEALSETATFAEELASLSRAEIVAIDNERWDFAKYVQAVARDQCEQLSAVVGRE